MPKPYGTAPLRRSSRIHIRVPVRISGAYPDGRLFSEDTHVLSISKFGAKFTTRLPLKVGMKVKVQLPNSSASAIFRVVWKARDDSQHAGEAGLEYLKVSNLLGVTFPE